MNLLRGLTALLTALVLGAGSDTAVAVDAPFEQIAFTHIVSAIENQSMEEFISQGDEQFRAMPIAQFKRIAEKFSPMFKAGYHSTYLGDFRDTNARVYYWKLEFSGELHDWVAKVAIGEGKVKGFLITRP
jgi:hypothetical protein